MQAKVKNVYFFLTWSLWMSLFKQNRLMKKVARRLLNEILFQSPCPPRGGFPRDVRKMQSMTTRVALVLSYFFFYSALFNCLCLAWIFRTTSWHNSWFLSRANSLLESFGCQATSKLLRRMVHHYLQVWRQPRAPPFFVERVSESKVFAREFSSAKTMFSTE